MSSLRSREELVHQTVTLYRQGLTRRAIARALQISRNTVRRILAVHLAQREAPHEAVAAKPGRAPRPRKIEPYRGRVAELLERYPGITAQRVFEELAARGFDGSYTAVKQYVRKVRPKPKPEPSLPTPEYGPGEMAESDWSPYTIDFTVAGRLRVQVLVYFLCFSRRKDFRIYQSCDFFALTDGHVQSFERFGGVARACKYDTQKPVILGWEGRQPIFNPRFLAFASHYEFRPAACRPRHPNDKPGAERSFWEFERSFLCGRSFRDPDDMRSQLAHWQDTVCDTRVHKKHKRSALQMFADERDHLVPLPRHPYDTARVAYRLCSIDGFVSWDGNRYAVPYEHVTDILPVRITQRELYVYAADLRCVARHELAPPSAGVDVDPDGLHPPWKRCAADLDQLRAAFAALGQNGEDFFAALSTATPRIAGHHARQILLLRQRYSTADLTAALRHARTFGALDHNAVARILSARAAPRTLAEYVAEDSARRIEQRLGPDRTAPRDLDEYDRLPLAKSSRPQEDPCPDDSAKTPPPPTSSTDSEDTSNS